ncbi:MAG TPA: hypothetical protein VGN88_06125 [Phycisphaerae bacterium]
MKRHCLKLIEELETRTLLSASLSTAPTAGAAKPAAAVTIAPISTRGVGVTLNLTAGTAFSGEVAFYPSPVLDPPLAYSASIAWGDGTVTQATLQYGTQGMVSGYQIMGTHTYANPGTFKMNITLVSGPIGTQGPPSTAVATRLVAEIVSTAIVVPKQSNTSGGVTLHETAGQNFTATVGSFTTIAPATNLRATISWGDGSSSVGQVVPAGVGGLDVIKFTVVGSHTYAASGNYTIHIVVTRGVVTPTAASTAASTALPIVAQIVSTAVVSSSTSISLAGTIRGTYSVSTVKPDVGGSYQFLGTGNAGALGAVMASGMVSLPGLVSAAGHATGTLTLANAQGTVTLQLTGPVEAALGGFPATLTYTILHGTGAYAGASASGSIAVSFGPVSSATAARLFTFVIM